MRVSRAPEVTSLRAILLAAMIILAACSSPGEQAADSPTLAPTETSVARADESAPATATVTAPAEAVPSSTPDESVAVDPVDESSTETEESSAPQVARFVIVPEETTAGYSIQEVFISDNNTLATAIGVTSEVQGGIALNYEDPGASEFEPFVVDVSTLKSDRSRRDRAIRARWLESAKYPLATFQVEEIQGFPEDPQEGVPITFQLAGELTVKETSRDVVWDVSATLDGDRLTGTASLDTMLADFEIPVPSIAGVLRVTDGITLTLDFVMTRVPD